MKRIIRIILIAAVLLIPVNVFASDGGFNLSGTSSMQKGASATFTISAYNSAGRLSISSSNGGVASVSANSTFVDSNTATFTVTANSAGTAVITVSGTDNYATFDSEESLASFSRSITVNVSEPSSGDNGGGNNNGGGNSGGGNNNPLPSTPVVKPSNNNTNNNNNNNNNNTTNNNTEEKKEEKKSTNNKLKKLTIENYQLKKISDNSYELTVKNNVNMVIIKAEAEDSKAIVSGNGAHELNIGDNKIEVVITAEDGSKNTIAIKIIREDEDIEGNVEKTEEPVTTTENNSINIIAIVMIGLNVILAIAVIVLFIKNKKLKASIVKNN